jgi:hypothetical protein
VRSVILRPWVEADVSGAVLPDRALLGHILFDLNNHLPNNLAHYQPRRIARSPRCFWYDRTYSLDPNAFKLRRLRFVVRDSDPAVLEVIWVVVVA